MANINLRYLKWLLINPKFYISISLSLLGFFNDAICLLKFSEYLNEPMNLFDAFIYSSSSKFTMTLCLLGLIFILSDIPIIEHKEIYTIMRISKKKWIISKVTYIISTSFIYLLIMMILPMLLILKNSFFSNLWSEIMYTMAIKNPNLSLDLFKINFPYSNILIQFKPMSVMIISFCLAFLYLVCSSIILLYLNIVLRKSLGFIIVVSMHFISYYIMIRIVKISYLSLFGNSLFIEHFATSQLKNYPTFTFSFLFFSFLIVLFILLLNKTIRKTDFIKILSKEELT